MISAVPRKGRPNAEPSFEKNLQRLERILEDLERGDTPLEESLRMYEEGVILSRKCMEILNQAEKKLRILSKEIPDGVSRDEE